jgi:hypothetical protein
MDAGDKYVHGPFTKGGGDEQVTREVIQDVADGPKGLAELPLIVAKIIFTGSELAPPSLDEVPQVTSIVAPPNRSTTSPAQPVPFAIPEPVPGAPPAAPPIVPNPDRPLILSSVQVPGHDVDRAGGLQPDRADHSADSVQHSDDGQHAADSHVAPSNAAAQNSNDGWPSTDPSDLNHVGSDHPIVIGAGGPGLAESHPDLTIHNEVTGPPSSQAAPAATPAPAPAAAPAPAPAPAPQPHNHPGNGPDRSPGHDSFPGRDKPDRNTPGSRDVSGIA